MATRQKKRVSIVQEFIYAVRDKIDSEGMSMVELSHRSGVARPYLYRVLSSEQTPSLEIAEKIAAALGLEFRVLERFQ